MANALTYIKNIGKSVGYASVEVFKEKTPVFQDFAETNSELISDAYKSVKDLKKNIKELPNKIMESEGGKFAKTYLDNLFDDIKTGKLYNKERKDAYDTEAASAGMGDTDLSVFDDFGDGDEPGGGFDLSELEDDGISSNEMMDIVGEKSANAVASAVARSSEYIVESNTQIAKASYRQMNAIYGGIHSGMATINQNLARVLEFSNENLNMHIENSKNFYEAINELDKERNQYLKEISDTLKAINEPASTVKKSDNKYAYSKMISDEGAIDLSLYKDYVFNNIKEASGGMFEMLQMAIETGTLKTFAASPLEGLIKGAIENIIPKALDKSMKNLNDSLSGLVSNLLFNLNEKAASADNPIWQTIANIFGIDTGLKEEVDPSKYERGKVPFDGITRKAIVEVIPTYLSRILSAINGQKMDTFDYDKGKYITWDSEKNFIKDKIKRDAKMAADDMDTYLHNQIKEKGYTFNSKEQEKLFWEDWNKIVQYMYKNQKRFNTRDKNLTASSFGLEGGMASDVNFQLIRDILDGFSGNVAYTTKMQRYRSDSNKWVDNLDNPILSVLQSGADKIGKQEGSEAIQGGIATMFTDANKGVIDKLQDIHKELSYIRIYGLSGGKKSRDRDYKWKPKFEDFKIPVIEKAVSKDETTNTFTINTKDEEALKHIESIDNAKAEVEKIKSGAYKKNDEIIVEEEVKEEKKEDPNRKKTISERMEDLKKAAKGIVQGPMNLAASVIDKVDQRIYELVYGPVGGRKERDEDDDRTLKEVLFDNLQNQFDKFATWMEEKVFDPLRFKSLKENAYDAAKRFLGVFGIDLDKTTAGLKKFFLGIDENGIPTKGGVFGKFINDFKETFKSVGNWLKGGAEDTAEWAGVTAVKNEAGKAKERLNTKITDLAKKANENTNKAQGKNTKDADNNDLKNAARGAMLVEKTGVLPQYIASEGEMIIPPDMNPFNVKKRESDEMRVKSKLQNKLDEIFLYNKGTAYSKGLSKNPQAMKKRGKTLLANIRQLSEEESISYLDKVLKKYSSPEELLDTLLTQEDSMDDESRKKISKYFDRHKQTLKKEDYERARYLSRSVDELIDAVQTTKDGVSKHLNISDDDAKKFKKNATDFLGEIKEHGGTLAAGATIGAGVSLITGLVGGPLVGAAAGAGTALIIKSKTVQDMLFGNEETGKPGVLPKGLTDFIKKYLPDMAKGGALGGIAAMLPFVPGGPVAGIMVGSAIGFAKNNEAVQNALFGENGIGLNKEQFQEKVRSVLPKMGAGALAGLLVGPFGSVATNLIVGSAIGFATDTKLFKEKIFGQITEFFAKDIIRPILDSFAPLRKQFELIGKSIIGLFKEQVTSPLAIAIRDKIVKPMGDAFGKLFNFVSAPAKWLISAPFKAIGGIGNTLRRHQMKHGTADYMSAEQRMAFRKKSGKFKMGFGLHSDMYEGVDESMVNMNTDQLEGVRNLVSGVKESLDTEKKVRKTSFKNISEALSDPSIGIKAADRIKEYVNNGEYKKALEFAQSTKAISNEDVRANVVKLLAAEFRKLQTTKDIRKGGKDAARKALESAREMGIRLPDEVINKALSGGRRGLADLENYLNKEIDYRKSTEGPNLAEQINENDAKRHNEIVKKFDELINAVKQKNDPESVVNKAIYDANEDPENYDDIGNIVDESFNERGILHGSLSFLNRIRKKISPLKNSLKLGGKGLKLGAMLAGAPLAGGKWIYDHTRDTKLASAIFGDRSIDIHDSDTYREKIEKKKTRFRILGGGESVRIEEQNDGREVLDKSDPKTKKYIKEKEQEKESQRGIFYHVKSFGSGISGLFHKFFGIEKEESPFAKILKIVKTIGTGVLGLAGIGWAKEHIFPGVTMFWEEKVSPYLDQAWNGTKEGFGKFIYFFNPKNPEGIIPKLGTLIRSGVDYTVETLVPSIISKVKSFLPTMGTYVAEGAKFILQDVLPPVLSVLIKKLPSVIWSGVKGIFNFFKELFGKTGDGKPEDADIDFSDIKAVKPTWYDDTIATGSSNKIISTGLSTTHGSSSSATHGGSGEKRSTPTSEATSKTETYINSKPKAFESVSKGYQSKAASQYESVKSNIVETPYGEMTVEEVLNDDRVYYTTSDGTEIRGYDMLNYSNTAEMLGIDLQLTDKEMKANSANQGFILRKNPLTNLADSAVRTVAYNYAGRNVGKTAGKVVRGSTKIASLIPRGVGTVMEKIPTLGTKIAGKLTKLTGNLVEGGGKFAGKTLDFASDIGEYAAISKMEKGGGAVKNLIRGAENAFTDTKLGKGIVNIGNKIANSKFGKAAANSTLNELITKMTTGIKGFFKNSKIVEYLTTAVTKSKGANAAKFVKNGIEAFCEKIIHKLGNYLAKSGSKAIAKAGTKLAAYTASAATLLIADAIISFLSGFRNANSILGITEQPSFIFRVIAGIAEALNSVFLLGLVPLNIVVDIIVEGSSLIGLDIFDDLKEKRAEAEKELEAYNDEKGTNLSIEEYNKKDRLATKAFAKVKSWFSKEKVEPESEVSVSYTEIPVIEQTIHTRTLNTNTTSGNQRSLNYTANGSGLVGRGSGTFISQVDPRYKNMKFNAAGDTQMQTLGDSGCAPAAAAMAVNGTMKRQPLSMEDASKFALNYKVKNDGVSADYFGDEFARHGIRANYITTSDTNARSQEIANQLMNNNKVVLMGQDSTNKSKSKSPFGPNPHYVVANGMSMDGNYIYINDPESNKPNIRYSADKILNSSKLGIAANTVATGSKALTNRFRKYVARGAYGSDTIQYKVWHALRKAGYNEIAVAAAMGNIQHESTFDPAAIEKGSGKGFGLVQWTDSKTGQGRRTNFENYARQKGIDPSSLAVQIEYLILELQANSGVWTKASSKYNLGSLSRSDWANGTDLSKATKAFMCCFERPSYDSNVNHIDRRLESASQYYEAFTGSKIDTHLNFEISYTNTNIDKPQEEPKETGFLASIRSIFGSLAEAYGLSETSESTETSSEDNGNYTPYDTSNISGNTITDEKKAAQQKSLVQQMYSVLGALKYSQGPYGPSHLNNGSRNPDVINPDGSRSGDCSSTVQWAYKKVLGIDPGSNTRDQRTNANTYTVATSTKDESVLQLGDLLLKDGHVEMYAGNNKMIGHGGGKDGKVNGPTEKTLDKTGKYNLVRRWIGFKESVPNSNMTYMASGSGLFGRGSDTEPAYNNALKHINNEEFNSILPFKVEENKLEDNKASIMQYNSGKGSETKTVLVQTKPAYAGRASEAKTNYNASLLSILASLLTLIEKIVVNTDQLNTIAKLAGEYIAATDKSIKDAKTAAKGSEVPKASNNAAKIAKQNFINALQGAGSSNEGNSELMRLIAAAERVARE